MGHFFASLNPDLVMHFGKFREQNFFTWHSSQFWNCTTSRADRDSSSGAVRLSTTSDSRVSQFLPGVSCIIFAFFQCPLSQKTELDIFSFQFSGDLNFHFFLDPMFNFFRNELLRKLIKSRGLFPEVQNFLRNLL